MSETYPPDQMALKKLVTPICDRKNQAPFEDEIKKVEVGRARSTQATR